MLDIRVVDKRNASEPGLGRMLVRETFGKLISGCFLGLGWFWAIWDRDAQAWHDKVVNTLVLHRQSDAHKANAILLGSGALILSVMFAAKGSGFAGVPLRRQLGYIAAGRVSDPTVSADKGSHASPRGVVLGFRLGESATDMARRAGEMGFTLTAEGCHKRNVDAPEYLDCYLTRGNGNRLEVSFLNGTLQRINLDFKMKDYDAVLKALERDEGVPRVDENGWNNWGSFADGYEIVLQDTYGGIDGSMSAVEFR
jgi:hypothetical protein